MIEVFLLKSAFSIRETLAIDKSSQKLEYY